MIKGYAYFFVDESKRDTAQMNKSKNKKNVCSKEKGALKQQTNPAIPSS